MNNLVTVNNGIATTTSLVIAEQFGRKHSHVLRSIEKVIGRYEIVPTSYLDSNNHPHKMYVLPEREALIVMPFIGGQKSIEGQERLVDAFLALRNMAIEKSPLERRINALELELTSIRKTGKYEANLQVARLPSIDERIKQLILERFDWCSERKTRMTMTDICTVLFDDFTKSELNKIKPVLCYFGIVIIKPNNKITAFMPQLKA